MIECLSPRVQDVDFHMRQIFMRGGKGDKDCVTILPDAVLAPLEAHPDKVRTIHNQDLAQGRGQVYLPAALARMRAAGFPLGIGRCAAAVWSEAGGWPQ